MSINSWISPTGKPDGVPLKYRPGLGENTVHVVPSGTGLGSNMT